MMEKIWNLGASLKPALGKVYYSEELGSGQNGEPNYPVKFWSILLKCEPQVQQK